MTKEERCKKCNHVLEKKEISHEIESKYLTIELSKILNKDYKTLFLEELKNQVCCNDVTFPCILVQYWDGSCKTMGRNDKDSINLTDIAELLDIHIEVMQKRYDYCNAARAKK